MSSRAVVMLALMASPALAAAPKVAATTIFPAVIPSDGSSSAVVQIRTDAPATDVTLELEAGGSAVFMPIDAQTFSAVLTPAQLLHDYAPDDVNRNFVGFLHVTGGLPEEVGTYNFFVNVDDAAYADVPVVNVALDLRCGSHVVNIDIPPAAPAEMWETNAPEPVLSRFYDLFGDDYDFVNLVYLEPTRTANRDHFAVKNDVLGIGQTLFDNTALYGSAGKLQGITRFPVDTRFDLASPAACHELGHQWISALDEVPLLATGVPHWPPSEVARGVMGFNIPGSSVGGEFTFSFVPAGGSLYTLTAAPALRVYTNFDLYLMGFLPASSVSPFVVLDPVDQPLVPGSTVTGTTLSVPEVVTFVGPRFPDSTAAPKNFRMATVVVTRMGLLTNRELAFFDHFATRGEATTPLTFADGFLKATAEPFHLSTQGIGTLDTSVTCPPPEIRPIPPPEPFRCFFCPPEPCYNCPYVFQGLDLVILTANPAVERVGIGLRSKVWNAAAAFKRGDLRTAGSQLDALLSQVRVERGKALTVQAADALTALTRQGAAILRIPLGQSGGGQTR